MPGIADIPVLHLCEAIMKKIILTGGGTAGHVTPNLALLPELKKMGFEFLLAINIQDVDFKQISVTDLLVYIAP